MVPYLSLIHRQGKWWFGSRSKTKDGVQASTASIFFKHIAEESNSFALVTIISKGCENEKPERLGAIKSDAEVSLLTRQVSENLGPSATTTFGNLKSPGSKLAFALLYAHLARIQITSPALRDRKPFLHFFVLSLIYSLVQRELLLQTPVLLGSLLSMALGHGWLQTTLEIMRLHAYFTQALLPGKSFLLQFPLITEDALRGAKDADVSALVSLLKSDKDRARSLLSAARHMGKLDVVDAQFKGKPILTTQLVTNNSLVVIGERLVTPGAFVQLVFKVRLLSSMPEVMAEPRELTAAEKAAEEEADNVFLMSKAEVEDLPSYQPQAAHAPHWPAVCITSPRYWSHAHFLTPGA